MNIGLLIIATNRYRDFLPNLLADVRKYFLTDHNVEVFVFSNEPVDEVTYIHTEHKPWPWMTLGRYALFKDLPQKDYYFYIDADTRIQNPIGDEILGDRVAAEHFGFKGGKGTHETNPNSIAYIAPNEDYVYYWGAFQGGRLYLEDAKILNDRIMKDFDRGIIATWHDESHWNRYLIDNPPTITLPYHYSCNKKRYNTEAKIVVSEKNNREFQI